MRTITRIIQAIILVAFLSVPAVTLMAQTVPNVFAPNTPANAADVNLNFSNLDGRVNTHIGDAAAHSDTLGGLGCASGQVAKWNGAAWACAADADTVTIDNDTLGTLSCAAGQVAAWTGAAWACAADNDSGGTVTSVGAGAGLTGGPITGSGALGVNFAGAGIANTVSRSDHTHGVRTIVVRPVLVSNLIDPVASGNRLLGIASSISNTNTEPILIKVEPGFYNIGTGTVILKPHVSLEGSGQAATFIIASGSPRALQTNSNALDNAVRQLTIENDFIGVLHIGADLLLSHVTIKSNSFGIAEQGDSAKLRDVTISVIGIATNPVGIQANITVLDMEGSEVTVTGGANPRALEVISSNTNLGRNSRHIAESGTITTRGVLVPSGAGTPVVDIRNSFVSATSGAGTILSVDNARGLFFDIAGSEILGAVTGSLIRCINSYTPSMVALGSGC